VEFSQSPFREFSGDINERNNKHLAKQEMRLFFKWVLILNFGLNNCFFCIYRFNLINKPILFLVVNNAWQRYSPETKRLYNFFYFVKC